MSTHDEYSERYREEFVDRSTPRDRALKREAIERENKFKAAVKELIDRLRLK